MQRKKTGKLLGSSIGVLLFFIVLPTSGYTQGDITAVNAGRGLAGGGDTGDVTLDVEVPLDLSGISIDAIVKATNVNLSGIGTGVSGITRAPKGIGVYGKSITSNNYGHLGSANAGVYGKNTGTGNFGYLGSSTYGVYGESTQGDGVYGVSTNGHGVYGRNTRNDNIGILGGYSNFGVYGKSSNAGVRGYNSVSFTTGDLGGTNSGVYGYGGENHTGVRGASTGGGTGVYGSSVTGTGVYGITASSTGFAGEFDGNVKVNGKCIVSVLQITGGSDLSEKFEIRIEEGVSPSSGMVVSIDPENFGKLVVSNKAYDRRTAGIISGAGNIEPGMIMGQSDFVTDGEYPVALTGRVYCLADASNGSIEPGDLLTTSQTPGHAMKVTDYARAQGAILGKAMSALVEGKGLVLVLVTLQ